MKNYLKIFVIVQIALLGFSAQAQVSVKRLNDPSIVAQHKRMTFESWGDWRPYPKYLLGIQTNFAYATVWGMWAPKINRDYKNGSDIRPLKPTGEQNQRLAQVKYQEEQALKIKENVDTLYKRSLQDLAHWTSLTVDADPLWLLYYKRMLTPLKNFPDNPQTYTDWKIKDAETLETLQRIGTIDRLREELDILKDKYSMSRTVDMPRGKRFLMYHETLIGWRRFMAEIKKHSDRTTLLIDYKKIVDNYKPHTTNWNSGNDKQIVQNVMQKFKNKY